MPPTTRSSSTTTATSTFEGPSGNFTPFEFGPATEPTIAPFLADVDTRGAGSALVSYGIEQDSVDFGGRDVFCVSWPGVGYFGSNDDRLNDFQLLLVERSDRDPGDFDIYFNYASVQWDIGDFNGGVGGVAGPNTPAGSSAGVGYASGGFNALGFLELPCSRTIGACLDGSPTALAGTSTTPSGTTPVVGRHIFQIESGGQVSTATVSGRVVDGASAPVAGAWVQVCPAVGRCRSLTQTLADGTFTATNVPPGTLTLRVLPPGTLRPTSVPVDALEPGEERDIGDIVVTEPTPPPTGVVVNGTVPGTIPSVVVGRPFPVVIDPPDECAAATEVTTPSPPRAARRSPARSPSTRRRARSAATSPCPSPGRPPSLSSSPGART